MRALHVPALPTGAQCTLCMGLRDHASGVASYHLGEFLCGDLSLSISLFGVGCALTVFLLCQVQAEKPADETDFRLEPQLLGVIAPRAGYFPYEANALGDYPYLEALEDFKEKQIGLSRDRVFTLQHVIFPGKVLPGGLWCEVCCLQL